MRQSINRPDPKRAVGLQTISDHWAKFSFILRAGEILIYLFKSPEPANLMRAYCGVWLDNVLFLITAPRWVSRTPAPVLYHAGKTIKIGGEKDLFLLPLVITYLFLFELSIKTNRYHLTYFLHMASL